MAFVSKPVQVFTYHLFDGNSLEVTVYRGGEYTCELAIVHPFSDYGYLDDNANSKWKVIRMGDTTTLIQLTYRDMCILADVPSGKPFKNELTNCTVERTTSSPTTLQFNKKNEKPVFTLRDNGRVRIMKICQDLARDHM